MINGCATSSLNYSDPFTLRQAINVNKSLVANEEHFNDAMQFCSFEAAYMDVSNDGGLLIGSAVGGAAAVAAAPAYFYAAPIFLLGGAVSYFLGKGTEKANEDNARLGVMVACIQSKGYEVLVNGAYTSETNIPNQIDNSSIKDGANEGNNGSNRDISLDIFNAAFIDKTDIPIYNETYKNPSLDKLNNAKTPNYPSEALKNGIEGNVKLIFRVSKGGEPINIKVHESSGNTSIDMSAVETLKSTFFIPARQDNEGVISKKVIRTYMFKADTSLSTNTQKARTFATN